MSKNSRNVYGPAFQMLRKWWLGCWFFVFFLMQWKLDRGNWFPGGLPWRQARLVSWCRDSQGEIFRVRTSHALSITDHPPNGRVNEPIFCRVWVLKIARFEGSGYLGWIISSRTFRIGASNRLEVVRAPGNGENMEAWPEVVVETLGRQ